MSEIKFKFRGRKYRVKVSVLIGACLALLGVFLLILVLGMKSCSAPASEPEETPEPTESAEPYDASAGVVDKKKYSGTMLEESEDAGDEYIESTLFLGDSNTARFIAVINSETKKTFTTKSNTIGVVGMGIDAIAAFPCMDFSTGRKTMPQSVQILQPERIIITMGTNNLYGSSTETKSFIDRYSAGIKAIEKAYPSVDIIVNAIPPVSKNTTYTNVKMVQIDAYNQAIAKMCQENKWKFLDSSEALKDEKSGYAKDGYMISDGLHLSESGLRALFKYIRTHSYITDDDRPKPLAAIPNIIGVPEGLIRTDPLTNTEFKEDPTTTETDAVPEPTVEPTPTPEETEEPDPTPTPEATAEATPTPTATPPAASSIGDAGTCQAYSSIGYVWSGTLNRCFASSVDMNNAEAEKKAADEAAAKKAAEEAAQQNGTSEGGDTPDSGGTPEGGSTPEGSGTPEGGSTPDGGGTPEGEGTPESGGTPEGGGTPESGTPESGTPEGGEGGDFNVNSVSEIPPADVNAEQAPEG